MTVTNNKPDSYRRWFICSLIYIIIDYGRPQDIFPVIGYLRPGMIIIVILTGFLFFKGAIRESSSKQTTMIWFFITLLALYIPFARNNYFAYKTTLSMLLYMPFILSTIICVNTVERLRKLILVLICIMIYVSLFSLQNKGMGSGNYFMDENDVALYINMWLPFCYFLLFTEKVRSIKLIYSIGLIIGILTIIISFSRGGFIGLICITLVSWLFSPNKMKSLVILCLLSLLFYWGSNIRSDPDRKGGVTYWEEIMTTTDTNEGTAKVRIESWITGWRMFLDNPFGVGGNNFQVRFPEYQTDFFKAGMWGRVCHSLWFTLLSELGIVGAIIYFLIIKQNFKDLFFLRRLQDTNNPDIRYLRSLSGAFIASIIGYFSSGTFLSVLYYPHYWYLTGMIAASALIARSLRGQGIKAHSGS